jgi:DNA-binding phage protein
MGVPRKQAVTDVARETGLPRREVYNAAVGSQRES